MQDRRARTGRAETVVSARNTADLMGSGQLPVFATPALVALMEAAACDALAVSMEEGFTTVGAQISVEHLSATPVGMRVWAEATLVEQDGRGYAFAIEAHDEAGLIGRATHRRVAVRGERFLQRAQAKSEGRK